MKGSFRPALAVLLTLPLVGCHGSWQSALDPKGPSADHLAWLIWFFTILLGVIWLLVMVAVAVALMRRRTDSSLPPPPPANNAPGESRGGVIVSALAGATAVIVLGLTGLSYSGQQQLYGSDEHGIAIQVTGHQWWWEVRYKDSQPSRMFSTANEIHVPIGVPVKLELEGDDVIHSFWVPNLIGKQDAVPGQQNQLTFMAKEPGIYRGQCAEFCGIQHAHMGLVVVVEDEQAFNAWRDAQIKPAVQPTEPERRYGMEVFLSHPCLMCHTIRGTTAGGRTGPDLTHLGSRQYLAAATLPLTRGSIAAWIADPHGIKPGVRMPLVPLEPDELNALAAYLEGLK